jgi:hypothetical protein
VLTDSELQRLLELSRQIAEEKDQDRFLALIRQMNDLLDEHYAKAKKPSPESNKLPRP